MGEGGNRHEIVLILLSSKVFYQSIFLAISNSFRSYEVIQIISELLLQTDTEGNRYRTFTHTSNIPMRSR